MLGEDDYTNASEDQQTTQEEYRMAFQLNAEVAIPRQYIEERAPTQGFSDERDASLGYGIKAVVLTWRDVERRDGLNAGQLCKPYECMRYPGMHGCWR
jgi:hypothetical protein